MTDKDNQRKPEDIEKDIHQSRERLDSTLHEIEERFSPQQLLNTSYEYIRQGGANEFVTNLGTTIKQNPLPFLLTSAGIGWLMLAQRNPNQGQHQHDGYASETDEHFYMGDEYSSTTRGPQSPQGIPVHEGTHPNGGAPAYSNAPSGVAGVSDNLSGSETHGSSASHGDGKGRMSRVKESASSMKGGAKGKAQTLGQKAKQTAQQWGDKAHHMGDNMRDSTSRLHHNTHDHMHNMGQRARHSEGHASDFIQEHPLVVGALGFALGAALGAVFPATKKEDEYMGEYRDRALHKAAESGQEQMNKAQHTIHEKADKAQQTVHEKAEEAKEKSHQDQGSNVNANQDKRLEDSDSSTERHSSGLAGSSTPSGNTQGSGTNYTP